MIQDENVLSPLVPTGTEMLVIPKSLNVKELVSNRVLNHLTDSTPPSIIILAVIPSKLTRGFTTLQLRDGSDDFIFKERNTEIICVKWIERVVRW